VRRLLKF
jgi:enhancing lycopene biosynthesis protein 2